MCVYEAINGWPHVKFAAVFSMMINIYFNSVMVFASVSVPTPFSYHTFTNIIMHMSLSRRGCVWHCVQSSKCLDP